jgi:alpha-N-arabinofuranosidase
LRSYGSPSYYAQAMLAPNKGDVVLPVMLTVAPEAAANKATPSSRVAPTPVFASATYATASHAVIVKVVNVSENSVAMTINFHGIEHVDPSGTAFVITGDPRAVNTLDQPTNIAPKEQSVTDASESFHRTFPPYSFTVLRPTATPK